MAIHQHKAAQEHDKRAAVPKPVAGFVGNNGIVVSGLVVEDGAEHQEGQGKGKCQQTQKHGNPNVFFQQDPGKKQKGIGKPDDAFDSAEKCRPSQ